MIRLRRTLVVAGLVLAAFLAAAGAWQAVETRRLDASHVYPLGLVSGLATDCEKTGLGTGACSCALGRLQEKVSYGSYQRLGAAQQGAVARSFLGECAAESHDYGPAFTTKFNQDCEQSGEAPAQCRCVLEQVQRRFTRAEYEVLDRAFLTTGQPPPALAEALSLCDQE